MEFSYIFEKVDNKDINIISSGTTTEKVKELKKLALAKKHEEIKNAILEPYTNLSEADLKYYEPNIKKQTINEISGIKIGIPNLLLNSITLFC